MSHSKTSKYQRTDIVTGYIALVMVSAFLTGVVAWIVAFLMAIYYLGRAIL